MLLWAVPLPVLLEVNAGQSVMEPVIVQAVAGWAVIDILVEMDIVLSVRLLYLFICFPAPPLAELPSSRVYFITGCAVME